MQNAYDAFAFFVRTVLKEFAKFFGATRCIDIVYVVHTTWCIDQHYQAVTLHGSWEVPWWQQICAIGMIAWADL